MMVLSISFGNVMWVLANCFQLTGGLLLLQNVRRVGKTAFDPFSLPMVEINEDLSVTVPAGLIKDRLRANYLNWCTFAALIMGYAASFWGEASSQIVWAFAAASVLLALGLSAAIKAGANALAENRKEQHRVIQKEDIPADAILLNKIEK